MTFSATPPNSVSHADRSSGVRSGVSVLGLVSLALVIVYGFVAALTTVIWLSGGHLLLPYNAATATPADWKPVLGVAVALGALPVCLAAGMLSVIALAATRRHVGLPLASLVVASLALVPAGALTVWAGTFVYLWGWGR